MQRPSVLFVCLGNICRSPLAEAAFRDAANKAGLECEADSAGTGDWHKGQPPDKRAQAEALKHGISIKHYRARQICAGDFTRFDHIVAMDKSNLDHLLRIAPEGASAHISLLLDQVPGGKGASVDDPYYGDADDFARCWTVVSAGVDTLVKILGAQH